MIRTVPTGDLGLDLLLGGGWRLVERLPDRVSASVLVRGGAGAGKTLLGLHAALGLAAALDGDVVVACVEILPSEYVAQVEAARPDLDLARVVALPSTSPAPVGPRVYCGLLTELDPGAPDLVASLESLGRDVAAAGGKAAVFIVDSLIEGYGIGSSAARTNVDAVTKFAAQSGCGMVLCEEARKDETSPWTFAVDTVLELGVESRERGRWIEVRKHRFGPSVSGHHELDLGGDGPPKVYPEPYAWVARRPDDVLRAHGWVFGGDRAKPRLSFHPELAPSEDYEPIEGSFILVSSDRASLARTIALALLPAKSHSERDLYFHLDPQSLEGCEWSGTSTGMCWLPAIYGPARALRGMIDRYLRGSSATVSHPGSSVRRIVIGDLDVVLAAPDFDQWIEAVRVFSILLERSGTGVPLILSAGEIEDRTGLPHRERLAKYVDVRITVSPREAWVFEGPRRSMTVLKWTNPLDEVSFPADLAHFDRLPRPPAP